MSEASHLFLDRFEDGVAVLIYGGREIVMPRGLLPDDAREGDYLRLQFSIDPEKRATAGQEIEELQKRLQARDHEQQ